MYIAHSEPARWCWGKGRADTATLDQRRLALVLYLEGLGFRSICRILEFNHVAVYQWVKAFGKNLEQFKRPAAQIVELDELHSYVGHNKKLLLGLDCC